MNEINNTINSVFVLFEATINQMIDKRVEAKRDDGLDRLWEENQALKVRIEALEKRQDAEHPDTKFDLCILESDEFKEAVSKIAEEVADSAAREVLDDHTSEYDHDNIRDEIDEEAVTDIVNEILRNVTVRLDV